MGGDWVTTLAVVAARLNRCAGLEWMLVGSAATALRVGGISPKDIDIAVRDPQDVARAATVLPTPQSPETRTADDPAAWVSTMAEPTLNFGDARERWSFGVWLVEGVKVELAHIDAPDVASLLIETRSVAVWHERDILTCRGEPVPAVPIETQLATMAARRQDARLDAVLAAIGRSPLELDLSLLRRAVADRQAESPGMVVPESLRAVLPRRAGSAEPQ